MVPKTAAGKDLGEAVRMRKQYNFWPGEHGVDAWDIDHLIELSRDLPICDVPLDSITEVDTDYWFRYGPVVPTVRLIVEHRS